MFNVPSTLCSKFIFTTIKAPEYFPKYSVRLITWTFNKIFVLSIEKTTIIYRKKLICQNFLALNK